MEERWSLPFAPPRPGGRPALTVIRPGLLVGPYPVAEDAAWLRGEHAVSAVVSLQDDADLASKGLVLGDLTGAYAAAGIAFHRIPIPDGDEASLAARLDDALALLDALRRAGGRVYLHCNAGFNRAPTVAIAYLHVHEGLPLAAAAALVKRLRPCVPYLRLLESRFAERGRR
ncbi:MAG TPA: dual specificity protein phosphatase family protein [Candidatus Binatia bacterium]|nr:dual specificity protein phosphatase family protein [Candidatus Binatia bacterium]